MSSAMRVRRTPELLSVLEIVHKHFCNEKYTGFLVLTQTLRSVPKDSRKGFVFNPILSRGECRRIDTVSKAICSIGERAAVKVDDKGGTPVWASAHDLRRAFGARWSRKVNSMVLKELMRHASVTTTEKYYVGIQSDETSALLAALMPDLPAPVTTEGDTKSENRI